MASFLNGPSLNSQSFEIFENDDGDDNVCEGWLLIKKQSKSGWKKRFCKIYVEDNIFSLYDGTSIHLDPKLVFQLDSSATCEIKNDEKNNKKHCFVLNNNSQTNIVASAFDEIDKNICINFIQNILDNHTSIHNNDTKRGRKSKNNVVGSNLHTLDSKNNMQSRPKKWKAPEARDLHLFNENDDAIDNQMDNTNVSTLSSSSNNNYNISSTTTNLKSFLNTKQLNDVYYLKPFQKDVFIQNAYKNCTKNDLINILKDMKNDRLECEKKIKNVLINNFNIIMHVNSEGHDFIKRNNRYYNGNQNGESPYDFNTKSNKYDNDDIDIDKAIGDINLKAFLSEQKEYSRLVFKLGSLLEA
jgi:hypothetical protein